MRQNTREACAFECQGVEHTAGSEREAGRWLTPATKHAASQQLPRLAVRCTALSQSCNKARHVACGAVRTGACCVRLPPHKTKPSKRQAGREKPNRPGSAHPWRSCKVRANVVCCMSNATRSSACVAQPVALYTTHCMPHKTRVLGRVAPCICYGTSRVVGLMLHGTCLLSLSPSHFRSGRFPQLQSQNLQAAEESDCTLLHVHHD